MHSANMGKDGDTAVFFGLSNFTDKLHAVQTLTACLLAMMNMAGLQNGVFNFEGGCYTKCIDLSEEKEPEIFNAIPPALPGRKHNLC